MVEGRSIQDGIRQLEGKGVSRILAVPLFVSSGSTHIQEIRQMLGLPQEIALEAQISPLHIQAEIEMVSPMDDHPLILEIIEKRIEEMSSTPKEEVLMLVGHGSRLPDYALLWESMMERMAKHLQIKWGFKKVMGVTLLPDQLADCLKRHLADRVVIVPLFLSEGYFTKKVIPSRISGTNYIYNGKTYLPDALVSQWIEAAVMEKRD
jgi:sirohydrochlorin ferrochelatase